jgi:hypothetical protein
MLKDTLCHIIVKAFPDQWPEMLLERHQKTGELSFLIISASSSLLSFSLGLQLKMK